MTVQLDKSTIYQNIYKNFYDVVAAISGFSGIVYPGFPDIELDSVNDYPIVVINPAEIEWDRFTFGKSVVTGTITIDIFTNEAKDTDTKSSSTQDAIEQAKGTFAGIGLRDVQLERTTSDQVPQGKIKVYLRSIPFKFKYYFDKTKAF